MTVVNKIKVKQRESSQKEVRHELDVHLISLTVDSSDYSVNHFMKNLQSMMNKYGDLSKEQLHSFVEEVTAFLNHIQEYLERDQYLIALKMGHVLYECCLNYVAIDLEGLLQPVLEDIENQLYEIIEFCVEEGNAVSEVFDYIKTQAQTQDLNQLLLWMNLMAEFDMVSDTYFNQLIEKVTTLINNTSSDEMKDELYLFVAQILEQTNRVSQLQQFLTKNQHIESLEVLRIEQAMLDQKYEEAIWRIEALK